MLATEYWKRDENIPKFKIWSEVVFDYSDQTLIPLYLKIWSVTYCEKTKKWLYNFNWETSFAEENLRHATLPEVVKYFRP